MLKNFRLNIILRVLLIVLLAIVLSWVLTNTTWLFTPLVASIILIGLIANLIGYVERTNRNLGQFIASIQQGGFTNLFKQQVAGGSHSDLNEVYNAILKQFQKITIEKESHYQYLKTLNENLGVSLLSYDQSGTIHLMNPAAKSLLKKPYLKNIEDLRHANQEIYSTVKSLEPEENKVIKTVVDGTLLQLSIRVKDFVLQAESFRLVLIQNIHHELEEKEVEAWQKLISVLTHEIMNSVTPIASLSAALNQQVQTQRFILSPEDEEDVKESLAMIENRSKGLMRFVNAYKDFTKKPDLSISEIDVKKLTDRIVLLLTPDLQKGNIKMNVLAERGSYKLKGDQELIEQVIINILKNAIEICESLENASIEMSLKKTGRRVRLEIRDNGPGIPQENLDKIFVPFFTTKRKGTGIGLSFARQIMRLHNGSISVQSKPGEGTVFILEF